MEKLNNPINSAKVIPLAFNESMSYYECICNISNHINNEIIPAINENSEEIINLKNYVDDNMLTKNVDDLTYYTKTSDLSPVSLTGDYDDLSNKPDLDNYVTKDVNDLTYYTKTSDLSSVALTGDYDDLIDKPTIPDVSNFITKDVNDLTYYTLTSNLSSVATSGNYNDLSNKPTIPTVPTNVSAFTNDSGYITKNVNDLVNYTLTTSLSTVATSGNYNDLSNKPTIPDVSNFITKDVNDLTYYTLTSNLSTVATSGSYNDLSNKPTIPVKMSILKYGTSTWNDFINAYNENAIVYCRASSNSNPATGSQTRLAFMAYVNNETTPTEVEFQYYRSVNTHSDSQQGDQVFVYKLTNASGGTWTVTTRNAFSKVVAGTNLSSSYSNGVITLNNTLTVPTKTSDLTNDSGYITNSVNNLTNYTKTSDLNTYSSNEIVCGKWIDNKPIYRRVFTLTTQTSPALVFNNNIDLGLSNISTFTRINGILKTGDNYNTIPAIYIENDALVGRYNMGIYRLSRGLLYIGAGSYYTENLNSYTLYLIVEYTKTTD